MTSRHIQLRAVDTDIPNLNGIPQFSLTSQARCSSKMSLDQKDKLRQKSGSTTTILYIPVPSSAKHDLVGTAAEV